MWLCAPLAARRVRHCVCFSLEKCFNKHETLIRTQLNDQRRRFFSLFSPVWTNRSAIAIDNIDNKSHVCEVCSHCMHRRCQINCWLPDSLHSPISPPPLVFIFSCFSFYVGRQKESFEFVARTIGASVNDLQMPDNLSHQHGCSVII